MKKTIIRGGLETLYFSGLHHWMRPLVGGVGTILTLHHVRPARASRFQPNRLLEISPNFFERLLRGLRRARNDLISLDEMHQRLVSGNHRRRFVCVTFDDGVIIGRMSVMGFGAAMLGITGANGGAAA